MNNYLSEPFLLITYTIIGFLKYMLTFRFLFELMRVNFYNPICQSIVMITKPILTPLKILQFNLGRINITIFFLVIILIAMKANLQYILNGTSLPLLPLLILSFGLFIQLLLNIFFYLVIINAIASWFFMFGNKHPLFSLIEGLCFPLYTPIRKIMPQTPGIDFSPIILLLLIQLTQMIVLKPIFEIYLLLI